MGVGSLLSGLVVNNFTHSTIIQVLIYGFIFMTGSSYVIQNGLELLSVRIKSLLCHTKQNNGVYSVTILEKNQAWPELGISETSSEDIFFLFPLRVFYCFIVLGTEAQSHR